ncbi:DedA family protein [Microlunatus sp. Y2014]|uniref:DedA family protein n=1 Tax=Microlunatus sp. Y2014 TaxID=3418488 RepID=UPI003DA75C30
MLSDLILAAAGAPWIYLVVLLLACIDGFFPPLPSESVVVALAAIAASTGEPNLIGLGVVAAVGAFAGDNIAYALGRRLGIGRFAWLRRPRIAAVFAFATRQLERRAAVLILAARYIPVGRVAVNMTAGATGYPRRRFLPLAALAAVTWSAYSILIGTVAGNWVHDNPLLGAAIAVAFAMALGFVVDKIVSRVSRRRETIHAIEAGAEVVDPEATRTDAAA